MSRSCSSVILGNKHIAASVSLQLRWVSRCSRPIRALSLFCLSSKFSITSSLYRQHQYLCSLLLVERNNWLKRRLFSKCLRDTVSYYSAVSGEGSSIVWTGLAQKNKQRQILKITVNLTISDFDRPSDFCNTLSSNTLFCLELHFFVHWETEASPLGDSGHLLFQCYLETHGLRWSHRSISTTPTFHFCFLLNNLSKWTHRYYCYSQEKDQ